MSTNGQVKEYVPIRENDEYMKLVRELSKDKIATWNVVYEEVANFYPDEDHEWQATRATHINIDLQKDLYHKWEKERHHVASLPEPLTPREQAVYDSELDTYVETVAQGHENLDKTITGQTMQMFGFKSLPKDKDVWLEIAKIVWRYQDRIDQGMDEYYAVVGTADEFDIPYEIIDMPPNPEEEQEQEEADEIPF